MAKLVVILAIIVLFASVGALARREAGSNTVPLEMVTSNSAAAGEAKKEMHGDGRLVGRSSTMIKEGIVVVVEELKTEAATTTLQCAGPAQSCFRVPCCGNLECDDYAVCIY